jgi:hypothetical protein
MFSFNFVSLWSNRSFVSIPKGLIEIVNFSRILEEQ